MEYDVFICHASEDKIFVEPLAKVLMEKGLMVWYDRFELKMGDSLRQRIDQGLANSRYGIVVVSKVFFNKNWPQAELDALAGRQNSEGRKVILPIWHEIEAGEVQKRSPLLASLLAARSIDGMDSVVSQILTVVSQPDESVPKSVFHISGSAGLRERCLDVIRNGNHPEWAKLVDELQSPIDERLMAWKQEGETAVDKRPDARREAVLKATEICLRGFVPLFAAVEAGKKALWQDALGVLLRLATLEERMGGGNTVALRIGRQMLYVAGNMGMAIAVRTKQHDFVQDWMRLPMPGYRSGQEIPWAEVRQAFWAPFTKDYKDPFRFLLNLHSSEYVRDFFPNEERMKDWLFKTNLLQSIVELSLLTRTQGGVKIVEAPAENYESPVKVVPWWLLIQPEDFQVWTLDLFRSSAGFLQFFLMDYGDTVAPNKIWNWWKGWKTICRACIDEATGHRAFFLPLGEWLMLPGEPPGDS
jgi:hypothetical protein